MGSKYICEKEVERSRIAAVHRRVAFATNPLRAIIIATYGDWTDDPSLPVTDVFYSL